MEHWFVVGLAAINAAISLVFAYGVSGRAASWHWPPSWLRVIANWLVATSIFFSVSITFCWAAGIVQFSDDDSWLAKAVYLVPLVSLVCAQAVACMYWLTGRALQEDVVSVNGVPVVLTDTADVGGE